MLVCRVLGPLEVWAGDARVEVGGQLPRRLLTALVAAGGRPVPDDRLAELVWDGRPPQKAGAALQVYVSRLRTALGPAHRDRLRREGAGYVFRPDAVDTTTFVESVESRQQLAQALRLWRGEPYAELPAGDLIDAQRSRLTELREVALEELAAVRLQGDPAGAVADLEELVRAAPLRERRWALLVLALYRSGRQGDALAAVRRVRALLADELGADPGTELQDLERRVLAQDPALEPSGPARPRPVVRRPLTAFLGRDQELRTISQTLDTARLVTLVGPAGVGKTRLAVEYVASPAPSHQVTPDQAAPSGSDVWFARLADVRQADEVASVVADAAGLVAVTGDPATAVIRALGNGRALLVLDNCEHLTEAAADLAATLLAACENLTILATSREPLGLDGEVTIGIGPLAEDAAADLLLDRVRSMRPGWTPAPDEQTQALKIGTALDGLPLAIELAAARARVLGLAEIAERLDDRFALLGPVPRGSVTAHATLEAAIGWSVDLLSENDRALLLRLWPFEGGLTLAAADAVSPNTGTNTLEELSSLVTRSVVVADTSRMPTRYLLLESIRAYCEDRDPDPGATREVHAAWVRELAAQCFVAIRHNRGGQFLKQLRDELPNIRAGLAYDVDRHPVRAVQTAGRLSLFFTRGVHHAEALRLVKTVLARGSGAPALERARLTVTLDALTYFAGDFAEASRIAADLPAMIAGFAPDEDPVERGEVLFHIAFSAVQTGNVDVSIETADAAVAIGHEHDLRWLERAASTVRSVAVVLAAYRAGDETALIDAARAAQLSRRGWAAAWSHWVLGEAYLRHPGEGDEAVVRARDALAELRLSLELFGLEEDVPYALGVLYCGALALARNGRQADGVRLLAAVHEQVRRLGVVAPTFFEKGTAWIEDELGTPDPEPMSWDQMIALLDG